MPKIQEARCRNNPAYFLTNFCQVYDATKSDWIPFDLWPAQQEALASIHESNLIVALKARQLGFSWLVLGYILWLMTYRPAATVLIFSKRDDEAVDLLGFRLKGMWDRLPDFLRPPGGVPDRAHQWMLDNGSRAMAMPTTGGRSYTGTFVLVDEADWMPDLNRLLNAVKPTIDAGGKLVLLSSVDKSKPQSAFKRIYKSAKAGGIDYRPIFYGWDARPGRTAEWYESQRRDSLSRTGSLDDLHQEYPATDAEALSARTLDKRIPKQWLDGCYIEQTPLTELPDGCPSIPGLRVFRPPASGRLYVIGTDPAKGNPTSDDSAAEVLDLESGEQVAELMGKIEMNPLADAVDKLGRWYNQASVMVLRNNHGHAVILWLRHFSPLLLLPGSDGQPGWVESPLGNTRMYDSTTEAFRHKETILHSFDAYLQLSDIDGNTLAAAPGNHDDLADAYAAAIQGRLVVYGALASTAD